MTDVLDVVLGDVLAGTLTRLAGGRLRFDYDDDYRNSRSATPLSVSMPTTVRSHPDGVISPWLWGLLPDNQAVLERWARDFHASASSPFSLLATPIGHDCAGAVRFAAPGEVGEVIGKRGAVTWLTDEAVAQRLRELREDTTAWLGREFTGQFSLAGAQAKTALLHEDGRWGVPSGSAATSHILKPAVAGLDGHDQRDPHHTPARHRAHGAAHRHQTVPSPAPQAPGNGLSQTTNTNIFRWRSNNIFRWLLTLGINPARKYQNEGGPGPREVAHLFRDVMPPRVADEAVWRFFDALAWNWLVAGTDAHAKNYSLLLAGSEVRLAPLYDVASALPYGVHERKLRFAMKIGGDNRVYTHHNTWKAAAQDLGVDADHALDRVLRLAERVPAAFAEAAATPEVAALKRPLPARLVDLVSERVQRCQVLLRSA